MAEGDTGNGTGLRAHPTTTQTHAAVESCDVSVVIPAYNRALLLPRTLASVSAQTLLPLEVIVVDDGSSVEEATKIRSIVSEFERSINVKLLVNEKNRGLPYARNRGMYEVRGKYVAFLDSDDLWMPEKLEKQLRLIESVKGNSSLPVFSATGYYRVDNNGEILLRKPCESAFDAARIRRSNFIHPSSIVVETSVAREIDGFAEDVSITEDWDFYIRLVGRVQFVSLPDPVTIVVDHENERLSQNNPKTLRAMLLLYRKHMRGTALARENSGFYRNLATELQAHGKPRTAKKFYIRSIGLKYRDGLCRRLIEGWLNLYFQVKSVPSLKERRRIYYLRQPTKRLRDPRVKQQWDQDQKVIWALMRRQ
jgi:glycosyltransferase involved in cell wall biosynthesis